MLGYLLHHIIPVRYPSDSLWLSYSFQSPYLHPSLPFSTSPSPSDSSITFSTPSSASAFPALIPRISRVGCSHHRLNIRSPGFRSAARNKYMIVWVAMYCATVFWWREIYALILSRPTIASAAPMGEYTHVPSRWFLGPMPVIRCTAQWWKPSRVFYRQGVSTYVLDPHRLHHCHIKPPCSSPIWYLPAQKLQQSSPLSLRHL